MPVNTRFRDLTQRLSFQVLPRIYFSSGGAEDNVGVKKLISISLVLLVVLYLNYGEKSQIKNGRMLDWYGAI